MTTNKQRPGISKKMRMVIGCSLVVGVCLLLLYAQQKNRAQQAIDELTQLQRNAQRITALRRYQHPPIPEDIPIQTLLKQAAQKCGVLLGPVHSNENTLDVVLPRQPVKPLLLWLESLQQEYGIRVDVIDLSLSRDADVVRVKKLLLQATPTG